MTNFTRTFDTARREQGFRSQADLDAFFAYYDHTCVCAECQKPGKSVALDNGYQPTMNRCEAALSLQTAWHAIHDNEAAA